MPQLLVDTNIDPARLGELQRSTGLSIAVAPGELDTARALPAELLNDVRAILCTYVPTNFAQMPSLELVQLCSAGFAQVENLGHSNLHYGNMIVYLRLMGIVPASSR